VSRHTTQAAQHVMLPGGIYYVLPGEPMATGQHVQRRLRSPFASGTENELMMRHASRAASELPDGKGLPVDHTKGSVTADSDTWRTDALRRGGCRSVLGISDVPRDCVHTCAASVGAAPRLPVPLPAAASSAADGPAGRSPRRSPSSATTASMNSAPAVPCGATG